MSIATLLSQHHQVTAVDIIPEKVDMINNRKSPIQDDYMQSIMQAFRGGIQEFGGRKVVKLLDYAPGLDGLPKSDVLKFLLEDNCSIVVRPSGTEPKLKTYISVSAENKEAAEKVEAEISKSAEAYLK